MSIRMTDALVQRVTICLHSEVARSRHQGIWGLEFREEVFENAGSWEPLGRHRAPEVMFCNFAL